jgi:hypothetical protein
MKKLFIMLILTPVLLTVGCHSGEDTVMCVQLDPLKKVFKEEMYFEENSDTAAVAKGETATFQFVVRSIYPVKNLKVEAGNLTFDSEQIPASMQAFVGYIHAGRNSGKDSKDKFYPVSDYYPDCLEEVESVDMPSMSNQPVWVTYAVPRSASDGTYSATLVFSGTADGKPFKIKKQVTAKVYNVVLPEQTLWITNWFTLEGLSKMNNNEPVEPYSDRYWALLKELANIMRDHSQNVYMISPSELCKAELTGTKYAFDFTNFDKTVELFIREGGLKRIEGGHLGGGLGNGNPDFGIKVPNVGMRAFDNDTTRNFLSQFIPALYNHLETKGWTKMYVQHIGDEPTDRNAQSYIRIAEYLKEQLPNIKIIDAVLSHQLANTVNVWAPVLHQYHRNYAFYQERQAAGDEVWFYTCCGPQNDYANRFLEQPLVQMRILHWMNYRYGATGYLHWGFNWWHLSDTGDAAVLDKAVTTWTAGDSWIIYPAYGKVYSSIRLEAMRDGIADYELLKLLEQKDADKAKKLANAVVRNFDVYDSSIPAFRETRRKLLTWLSEL